MTHPWREPFDQCYKADKNTGCWMWARAIKNKASPKHAYGFKWYEGKIQLAHRVSWQLHRGEIPDGLCVLHKCDTPLCVNPKHLFLGTQLDNIADAKSKGRAKFFETQSVCKRGHPLSGENVKVAKSGNRMCRICQNKRALAYYHRQRAKEERNKP